MSKESAAMWEKFNSVVDVVGLKKDTEKAAQESGGGERAEVPLGTYEVAIEKLELKASKKGDPMVSVWFRIVDGPFSKSVIFMNQVVTQGFQIHIVNELLRSLDSGVNIEFKDYAQYGNMILDVYEAVTESKEYGLEYGETTKGFKTFKILEVFDVA